MNIRNQENACMHLKNACDSRNEKYQSLRISIIINHFAQFDPLITNIYIRNQESVCMLLQNACYSRNAKCKN